MTTDAVIASAARVWRAANAALNTARDGFTPKWDVTTHKPIPPTQAQCDMYREAMMAFATAENALTVAVDSTRAIGSPLSRDLRMCHYRRTVMLERENANLSAEVADLTAALYEALDTMCEMATELRAAT